MNLIIYFDNKITIYLSKINKNNELGNVMNDVIFPKKTTVHKRNIIWRLGLEAETLFLQQYFMLYISFMREWFYMYVCNNSIPNIHDFNE